MWRFLRVFPALSSLIGLLFLSACGGVGTSTDTSQGFQGENSWGTNGLGPLVPVQNPGDPGTIEGMTVMLSNCRLPIDGADCDSNSTQVIIAAAIACYESRLGHEYVVDTRGGRASVPVSQCGNPYLPDLTDAVTRYCRPYQLRQNGDAIEKVYVSFGDSNGTMEYAHLLSVMPDGSISIDSTPQLAYLACANPV